MTPFIDSGNDLPDLAARAREKRPRLGRWYGWEILVADLATAGCVAGTRSPVCMVPYPFSGPAIHLANGRPGLAGASIGIRMSIAALAASIGRDFAHCQPTPARTTTTQVDGGTVTIMTPGDNGDPFCGLDYAMKGALVGAAIAAVFDAAIGFRRVAPGTPEPAGPPKRVIEPQLSFTPGGFNLGVGARF